jgi:CheY-like chemotaxis protein
MASLPSNLGFPCTRLPASYPQRAAKQYTNNRVWQFPAHRYYFDAIVSYMASARGPKGILIVDDHQVVRGGIRNLLDGHVRWEVCGDAENGREGLAKAIDLRPDLIILDISMPLMNGLEAAAEIRKVAPGTKIIVSSMHDSRQMSRQAIQAGAETYVVSSPFDEMEKNNSLSA